MRHRTRIHYTDEQKSQMWDRWQRGESLHQIARLPRETLGFETPAERFQQSVALTG